MNPSATPANDFSIKDALFFGWRATFDNYKLLIKIFWPTFVVFFLAIFISALAGEKGSILNSLLDFFNSAVQLLSSVVFLLLSFKIIEGKTEEAKNIKLSSGFPYFLKYLLANSIVSLIVFFGFLLLIIPGIIFMLKYIFTTYAVVDKNLGIKDSLSFSAKITKGKLLKIFGFIIVLFFVELAGLIALGLGLFVTIPVSYFAMSYAYKALAKENAAPAVNPAPVPPATPPTVPVV